ncbi:kinase-like protein [Moesziomyces antarcticus]|uniref:non-specific serine/threonine protein kinase n=2 Tax=Pseudozyma antarctica TaxID=84753 RepID=A0A081CB82_PSEA2|nr:kinase-like protein [Moesziomyces antarcticus]GAK63928.1 kinase-like protein [Moesziomyces antarcticus]SPO44861.1 related to IKS1 - putative serine/threonine kinase [Moesziomyces antarcticus]
MSAQHRPSPLRSSDATWVTSSIIDSSTPAQSSSSRDLVPAPRASDLQIILRTREHAAYYDPASNELSLQKWPPPDPTEPAGAQAPLVRHRSQTTPQTVLQRFRRPSPLPSPQLDSVCPTCARPWPVNPAEPLGAEFENEAEYNRAEYDREAPSYIAPNYFRLLAQATSTGASGYTTRPDTPSLLRNRFESASGSSTPVAASGTCTPSEPLQHDAEAQGYYARFFVELKRLGRGARGTVYLCQHVLNGNKLAKYAIKKIPVGDHAQSLLHSLNEVHLMESLHHPHLIHYQHAWIERCQLTQFGPTVPTLFVLMMAANGGSLADWISARAGDAAAAAEQLDSPSDADAHTASATEPQQTTGRADDTASDRRKIERLKAALRQRRANRKVSADDATSADHPTTSAASASSVDGASSAGVGVHLLREEEIYSLLHDMASGLGFLHERGILHLDIKPGNVLLHWDDDSLVPRALLSDFGSSLLLHDSWTRTRSGHTGTMEYMAPEAVFADAGGRLAELSSKADMWSLGVVLHLLLFFRLPYKHTDVDRLRAEMMAYGGFDRAACDAAGRRDDRLLGLLESLLERDPVRRPSCKDVLRVLDEAQHAAKAKRERTPSDDHRARVSLALHRPAALPPLPAHTPGDPQHLSRSTSWEMLPPEALHIGVALVKCLSPALVVSAPRPSVVVALATLVLLALVDLVAAVTHAPHRRTVALTTAAAHVALLAFLAA